LIVVRAVLCLLLLLSAAWAEPYTDPSGTFKLEPPAGWKLSGRNFISADKKQAIILLTLQDVKPLDQWSKELEANLKGKWHSMQVKSVKLGGQKARLLSGTKKATFLAMYISSKDGKGVIVTFADSKGDRGAFNQVILGILKSFKWR
jgi:hypothetical protein